MGEFTFNNRTTTQNRHSQNQSSSQQQQQPRNDRHQQNAASSYQTSTGEMNRSNYATLSDGTSSANCAKNSSRRGANFSVEFLHGSSGTSERLQQHDGQNHHRQNQHRSHSNIAQASSASTATSSQYRLDSQDQASSSLTNCGYYENYSAAGQWTTRDHSWSSESYQWWTAPGTNVGFVQPNCQPGSNSNKSGASSSKQTTSESQSSNSRNVNADQGACVNLSNSGFDASAPCSVSTSITPLTTTTSVWPSSSHSSYTSTNRFGYCAAPTFFPDPSNFSYSRQNSSSRKSLPVSTLAPVSTVTVSTTSHPSYSHYWSSSDWTSSFPVNAGSTSTFNLDIANGQQQQHQNHGKVQSFQIATMFPEVSSSSSTSRTVNWRPPDTYHQQQNHVQNDASFSTRMSSSSTSNYTYRQTTTDSSCSNLQRFL